VGTLILEPNLKGRGAGIVGAPGSDSVRCEALEVLVFEAPSNYENHQGCRVGGADRECARGNVLGAARMTDRILDVTAGEERQYEGAHQDATSRHKSNLRLAGVQLVEDESREVP